MKSTFYPLRIPLYFLMAKPTIKSVSELRGKMVAVSRFGGTTDLAARVALQGAGLDPHKDVVLIMIGLGNTRNAALLAGSVVPDARRLAQTAQGQSYQDNRQITVNFQANNVADAQAIAQGIADQFGAPSRFGTTPKRYP